jgi:hypothetical protein
MNDQAKLDDSAKPVRYEIRVRGHLSERLLAAFPALRGEAQGANTVLSGDLPDQAALYGVLAQLETLGLELLEIRRRRPDRPDEPV